MTTLSIIIPAYNVGLFLEDAVHSIDFIDNQMEIIIVNDGSTDNTLSVAQKLQSEIHQLRIIDQENAGLAQSRNNAISVAQGDYLMFLDADDRYKNNAISNILRIIREKAPELIIYNVEDYDIVARQVIKVTVHDRIVKKAGSVYWNKVYKATLFKGVDAPKGHLFEDSAVIPFIVAKAENIILIKKVLYSYSVNRAESIMTNNFGTNFKEKLYALEYLNRLNVESKLGTDKKKQVDDYIISNIAFMFRKQQNLKNMDIQTLHKMIDLAFEMLSQLGMKYVGVAKYFVYHLLLLRGIFYEKIIK